MSAHAISWGVHGSAQDSRVLVREQAIHEAALLARIRSGDSEAFGALYDLHGALVFGYATRLTGDPSLAEDVAQEVFLSLFRKPESYDPSRPFKPWLLSVVRNKVIDFARRAERRPETRLDPSSLDSLRGTARDLGVGEALEKALRLVPDAYREAVWLADAMGLTYSEIGETLGCDLGTVSSRVSRGRILLKDYFARNPDVV